MIQGKLQASDVEQLVESLDPNQFDILREIIYCHDNNVMVHEGKDFAEALPLLRFHIQVSEA